MGLKRPRAPNRRHLRVGASSAKIWATNKSSRLTPKFSSAFATAEANNLRTGNAAALGTKRSISNASFASLPRTRSTTRRTFWADIERKRSWARISCIVHFLKPSPLVRLSQQPYGLEKYALGQTRPSDGRPYFQ